jgi:hypothetical protein
MNRRRNELHGLYTSLTKRRLQYSHTNPVRLKSEEAAGARRQEPAPETATVFESTAWLG